MKSSAPQRDLARLIRQRLTAMRLESRLTLRDAAQAAGLSRGGLEKIESGANLPSIESLASLCSVYGSTLGALFASIEQQSSVAENLRSEWPDELMLADERAHRLDTLAGLAGLGDTWELAKALVRLREDNHSVSSALSALIEALAPRTGRHSAARNRAAAVAADNRRDPALRLTDKRPSNTQPPEVNPA